MTRKIKKPTGKAKTFIAVILFIVILYLAYMQFFYSSPQVNSNLFSLNKVFTEHGSDVWTVKFSPDGKLVASGGVDTTIRVREKESGKLILTLEQPMGITYLNFSADGNYLASSSYDEIVRLWKLPGGQLEKEFVGHKGTVWTLDISPDGNTIASSGEDRTIKLWDVKSGKLKTSIPAHELNVWDIKFSPDGKTLVSGSFDKTAKVWNVTDGKLLHTITDHTEAIVAVAFSHDGTKLVTTSDDKTVKIWDTHTWTLLRTLTVPEHQQAADFSGDDKLLVTSGRDKPATGEFLQNIFGDSKYNKGVSMRLWNVNTGELLQTFSYHANDVNDVAFTRDGEWIAAASSDKTVSLWKRNH